MIHGLLLVLALAPLDSAPSAGDDVLQLAQVQDMVRRAHAFLIDHQQADGHFSIVRGQSARSAPVAVTGLAALSLMAAGHLPDRGRYERAVKRAVDWLVDQCNDDGYFFYGGDEVSRMHGQGYALLALTQAVGMYGESPQQRHSLDAAIQRAVDLIERTQGLQGGWYYDPEVTAGHEGSITVCMIQALRAAKDAGFAVDTGVIDRAVEYMRKSQDPTTGRFRYAIGSDRTTWALTAAALTTLNSLGDYGSDMLEDGYDALRRDDPFTGDGRPEAFREYGAFYAAQCYWTHRDRRLFESWWPHFVRDCEDEQRPNGAFPEVGYGDVYATAIVSLTLQVPLGYLPMFHR